MLAEGEAKPDALTVGVVSGLTVAALTFFLGKLNRLGGAVLVVGVGVVFVVSAARTVKPIREERLGHPVSMAWLVLQAIFMYAVFVAALGVLMTLLLE
jgi:hypothetical protein